jgi:hypothetical protein
VSDWTQAEEFSGRRKFDAWRFALDRVVLWDWADIGTLEKRQWIERARDDADSPVGREDPRYALRP